MEYRICKNGKEKISVFGLGSVPLKQCNREETEQIMGLADEQGINLMDMYIPIAQVRDNIGSALRNMKHKWYIQGHLCTIDKEGQYSRTYELDKVKLSFEDMLQRMGIDYVDFGMLHYIDSDDEYEAMMTNGIYDYAYELRKAGVIKHLGFSSHNPYMALKMAKLDYIENCMFSMNPAYDMEKSKDVNIYDMMEYRDFGICTAKINPERLEFYNYCQVKNIDITAMKVFGGGTLLSSETSPFAKGMSPYQCIKYVLDKPSVVSAILGVQNVEELEMALKYFDVSSGEKDYSGIYTEGDFGVKGKCMYCGHCLPCTMGIDIAVINKYLDLATIHQEVPETVRGHYTSLVKHASDCIRCGTCRPNCPFDVDICSRMELAVSTFGF